jgi:hypothetical protein
VVAESWRDSVWKGVRARWPGEFWESGEDVTEEAAVRCSAPLGHLRAQSQGCVGAVLSDCPDWVQPVNVGSMGSWAPGKGVPCHGGGTTVLEVCEGEAQGLFDVEG